MIPILSIPILVSQYGEHFKEVFSEGEYEHFQRYLSGLLVSENKTIAAMNSLFVLDEKDQSSLNRFLTRSKYEVAALNSRRLGLLNSHEKTKIKASGAAGGVFSLDDTMLVHYGHHFEDIAKLFDHSTGSYVWAHNLVNLHYSDDEVDYPINFELWKPADLEALQQGLTRVGVSFKPIKLEMKQTNPKKWKQHLMYHFRKHQHSQELRAIYRTKITIGQDLLSAFFSTPRNKELDIPISFDRWFTNPKFCQFIDKTLRKAYVGGLKRDEHLLMAGSKKVMVSDFVKQLEQAQQGEQAKNFNKVTIRYKGKKEVFYNYCKVHHVCGYGRQRVLISHQKADLSDTARVFICNRLNWRIQHVTRVGRHRWPVEEYHREGKAEGLDKYQIRNKEGIEKHVALVTVVYSLLQLAQHDQTLLNKLQQQLNLNIEGSLAFWRRATQAQCLFVLIQWVQMAFHKGWSIQRIMEVLLPAYGLAA